MKEFETVFSVKPGLERLGTVFNLVESKYRFVKKQQETILDKLIEETKNWGTKLKQIFSKLR